VQDLVRYRVGLRFTHQSDGLLFDPFLIQHEDHTVATLAGHDFAELNGIDHHHRRFLTDTVQYGRNMPRRSQPTVNVLPNGTAGIDCQFYEPHTEASRLGETRPPKLTAAGGKVSGRAESALRESAAAASRSLHYDTRGCGPGKGRLRKHVPGSLSSWPG